MYLIGGVEILAGVLVAIKPRYGAPVVAAWLAGIIINLLTSRASTTSPCATSDCCSARSRWRGWRCPTTRR